jgi:hypothetical protein
VSKETTLFQSLFAKIMSIATAKALVSIQNVIVFLDGIHMWIVMVSTALKSRAKLYMNIFHKLVCDI